MKKMIDVDMLVDALNSAGMDAGICAKGSSSYPLVELAGGMEIYGFVPSSEIHDAEYQESLLAHATLDKLTK